MVDVLRLHVCNTPYDFSDATVADVSLQNLSDYHWNVGLSWPPGIERTLRLSLPPNHAATGDPVISGTVQVGEELTALTDGIMDDDVLDDVFTYQWVRVDADVTYTLTADDRGKRQGRGALSSTSWAARRHAPARRRRRSRECRTPPTTGAPTITGHGRRWARR